MIKAFGQATGAKLVGMWGVESPDLDFVLHASVTARERLPMLFEGDQTPAQGAATALGQMSMGHLADLDSYTLVETEDVDAAIKAHNPVTRAPGQA